VDITTALQLADWRSEVARLYAEVREIGPGPDAWDEWREGKETLYRTHPQSPVPPGRRGDAGVFPCFPYDAAMNVLAEVEPADAVHRTGDDVVPSMTRFATLHFDLGGAPQRLDAFWLDGYAGGLFVPFTDLTSGTQTYGGGRYILDTAKGADLGTVRGRLVLDFNFAYAPSCAHDPRWVCPLAGLGSRLDVAVRAGEMGP